VTPYGLIGRWRLQRRVADYRLGSYGRVAGELVVEADDDGLVWREQGTWIVAGRARAVARTYLLAGGWMSFDDGRPFHPWTPGEWVVHACGADVYRGLVDVAPARIRTVWDVTGPAKHQRLVTRFDKVWQSRDT
jgi:hypothetical protein